MGNYDRNNKISVLYNRARMTKLRLAEAIEAGAPAKKIARLQERYERQRQEWSDERNSRIKL